MTNRKNSENSENSEQARLARQARPALLTFALIHFLVAADICVLHLAGVSFHALASAACAPATLDLT
jgi:hypothetical protein